jgi:hypothetical protein
VRSVSRWAPILTFMPCRGMRLSPSCSLRFLRPFPRHGLQPGDSGNRTHAPGMDGAVCPSGKLPDTITPEDFAVFAWILPEGKYDATGVVLMESGYGGFVATVKPQIMY